MGTAFVGLVNGGEPAGVVLRFALRPDLLGLVALLATGVDEKQALVGGNGRTAARFARRGGIVNEELVFLVAVVGFSEVNSELLAVVVVLEFLAASLKVILWKTKPLASSTTLSVG